MSKMQYVAMFALDCALWMWLSYCFETHSYWFLLPFILISIVNVAYGIKKGWDASEEYFAERYPDLWKI